MDSVTVYQRLQTFSSLGPLDEAGLVPRVSVDTSEIIGAIAKLWNALGEHRSLFDMMEKEGTRRRTEQDVKLQQMQEDFENKLQQEAKKRQQEDDKLRAELQRTKDELKGQMDTMKGQMGSLEGQMSSSLDATIAQLKLQVANAHERIAATDTRLEAANKALAENAEKLRATDARLATDTARLEELTMGLYHVWDLAPKAVSNAVASHTGTALLLQTPPLDALANRIGAAERVSVGLRKDVDAAGRGVNDNTRRLGTVEADLASLRGVPERVSALEEQLRELVQTEAAKLRGELEDVEARLRSLRTTGGGDATDPRLARLVEEALRRLDGHDARLDALEAAMGGKADRADLDRLVTRAELEQRLHGLQSSDKHSKTPQPPPAIPKSDGASTAALLSLKEALDGLDRRLARIEALLEPIPWATPADVKDACSETLKATERAIHHIYDELRRLIAKSHIPTAQPAAKSAVDATAGRFRCLSCNRDAGPLSEDVRERLSRQQFPPSTTLMSRDVRESPPRAPSRSHVPGSGPMTSSRRKLQNYYDWLQAKETDPDRATTPPHTGRTVFLGAQSGGGGPGRQGGDHGSDDPGAIGHDGKYYNGVNSRPQSASSARPRSAGPLRSTPAAVEQQQQQA